MEQRKTSVMDKLAKEFDVLCGTQTKTASDDKDNIVQPLVTEDPDIDNTHLLGSGHQYPRPLASSIQTASMSTTNPSTSNNPTPPQTSTFKLLPTSASIREFSGAEPDYTAREYISLCEDVMHNSDVKDEGDKIPFVRSRLQPSSTASPMMQGTCFTRPQIAKDYLTFRSTFLETFGDNAAHSLVKRVSNTVDQLHKEFATKDLFEG